MTLFLMKPQFQTVTTSLNDLVDMMNNSQLFYNDPNKLVGAKENFAERLIKNQVAAEPLHSEQGMLTRRRADRLWRPGRGIKGRSWSAAIRGTN